MNTTKNNKRDYKRPRIKRVRLDNEISLVMASPMGNPPWPSGSRYVPGNINDPFKNEDYYG